MKFLVTGATGFIGGSLAKLLLEQGNEVVALCRDGDPPDGCEVVRGQLEDLATCERAIVDHSPDGVFHLAAQAIVGRGKRDPFATLEANVRGTYNLLEAVRRHDQSLQFVMASSDKAYGEIPEGAELYTEDMPLNGRGPYDVSKSAADLIARSYGETYRMSIAVIRAGNVYGPGDRDLSRIVPSLCRDVLVGQPLTIMSDGTPVREYLNIDDVTKGYIAAFTNHKGPFRAYNLGTGHALSVLELTEEFLRMLRQTAKNPYCYDGTPTDLVYDVESYLKKTDGKISVLGMRAGEINKQVLDPTRARDELGWFARRDLERGLKETLTAAWRKR